MKKVFVLIVTLLFMLSIVTPAFAGGGFDENGYNDTGNIFNGTGLQWCVAKLGTQELCEASVYGPYLNDHLVMKWSAEWNQGNLDGWTGTYEKAWVSNEWNGAFPGGSGEVWHYKIIWVGTQLEDSPNWRDGGYAI